MKGVMTKDIEHIPWVTLVWGVRKPRKMLENGILEEAETKRDWGR